MKGAIQRADTLRKNEDKVVQNTFDTYIELFDYKINFDKLIKSVPQFTKDNRDNLRKNNLFYQILQECLKMNAESTNFNLIKGNFLEVSERLGKLGPYRDKLTESYDKTFCGQSYRNINEYYDISLKNFNKIKSHHSLLKEEAQKQTANYEIIDIERKVFVQAISITNKHIRRLAKYHRNCLAELEACMISIEEAIYYLDNLDLEVGYDELLNQKSTSKVGVELIVSIKRQPVKMRSMSIEIGDISHIKAKDPRSLKIQVQTMESFYISPCHISSASMEFVMVEKKLVLLKSVTKKLVGSGIHVLLPCKKVVQNVCRYTLLASYRYKEDGIFKTVLSHIKSEPVVKTTDHVINESVFIYSEALKFKMIEGSYQNKKTKQLFQEKTIGTIYFTTTLKKNKKPRKIVTIESISSKETFYSLFVKLIVTRRRHRCYIVEISSSCVHKNEIKEVTISNMTKQLNVYLAEKLISKAAIIDSDFMTQLHEENEMMKRPSQDTFDSNRSLTAKQKQKEYESQQLEIAKHKKETKEQVHQKDKKSKFGKVKTLANETVKKENDQVRMKLNVKLTKMTRRQVICISEDFLCYERSEKTPIVAFKSSDSKSSLSAKSLKLSIEELITDDDPILRPVDSKILLKEAVIKTPEIENQKHIIVKEPVEELERQNLVLISDPFDSVDMEDFVDFSDEYIPLLPQLSSIPVLNKIRDDNLFAKPNSNRKTSLSVASIQPLDFPN